MSNSESPGAETDNTKTIIYIIVAVVAVLLIVGFIYLRQQPATGGSSAQPRLEGAGVLRAGSPDFDKYSKLITMDKPEATEAARPIGDVVMTLKTTLRNFTGHTINGLELNAAVVDSQGKPVKERTVLVIPTRQAELDNNQTIDVPVLLEGMKKDDDRANIKMEITGIRFK